MHCITSPKSSHLIPLQLFIQIGHYAKTILLRVDTFTKIGQLLLSLVVKIPQERFSKYQKNITTRGK
jgi:hypothetical protein